MAKRNGGRGGRKGGRGGGRGGGASSGGRGGGKPRGYNKGKGKLKSFHRPAYPSLVGFAQNDFPELMDLQADFGVQRPSGNTQFASEVENTRRNRKDLFGRQLRNRPVEFVKSTEVYDPSKLVNLKLKQKKISKPQPDAVEIHKDGNDDGDVPMSEDHDESIKPIKVDEADVRNDKNDTDTAHETSSGPINIEVSQSMPQSVPVHIKDEGKKEVPSVVDSVFVKEAENVNHKAEKELGLVGATDNLKQDITPEQHIQQEVQLQEQIQPQEKQQVFELQEAKVKIPKEQTIIEEKKLIEKTQSFSLDEPKYEAVQPQESVPEQEEQEEFDPEEIQPYQSSDENYDDDDYDDDDYNDDADMMEDTDQSESDINDNSNLFFIDLTGESQSSIPVPKKGVSAILAEKIHKEELARAQSEPQLTIANNSKPVGHTNKRRNLPYKEVRLTRFEKSTLASTEFNSTLTIGKVSLHMEQDSRNGGVYTSMPKVSKAKQGFKDIPQIDQRQTTIDQDLDDAAKEYAANIADYNDDYNDENVKEYSGDDYDPNESDSDLDYENNKDYLDSLRKTHADTIDHDSDFEFDDDYDYDDDSDEEGDNYIGQDNYDEDSLSGGDFELTEDEEDDITVEQFMSLSKGNWNGISHGSNSSLNLQLLQQQQQLMGSADYGFLPPTLLPPEAQTQTIKYSGKGKNKKPILDHVDDPELRDRLMQQFETIRGDKKAKRKLRHDSRLQQPELMEKYPYTMHIRDIKSELQDLYNDESRYCITFPPMDPHGIKTIIKMAKYFNLAGRRMGKGKKLHAEAGKTKNTYAFSPDYSMIERLCKQRPIFNRTDVKNNGVSAKRSKKEKKKLEKEKVKVEKEKGINVVKAHIKEGQVVGENAPEIGQSNIGRRMLERLGWKAGEGLGADHNKGISEPLMAKVKKTKLGIK